jgi:hypothetical protein
MAWAAPIIAMKLSAPYRCPPGSTCAYTAIVIMAVACPRRSDTTLTGLPLLSRSVVCVGRRLCVPDDRRRLQPGLGQFPAAARKGLAECAGESLRVQVPRLDITKHRGIARGEMERHTATNVSAPR